MQIIPQVRNNLQKYEEHQFTFGGINHSAGARDGAIYDMENMALDDAPSLSVRKKRQLMPYDIEGKVYGIGSSDKLFWCADDEDENAYFYYDGKKCFKVSKDEKTFAIINNYICIFPDKKYYSLWNDKAKWKDEENKVPYETLTELHTEKKSSADIKDGDVFAVGTSEPYSFFQYVSAGRWSVVKNSSYEFYALQNKWLYLMNSYGDIASKKEIEQNSTGTIIEVVSSVSQGDRDTIQIKVGYAESLNWIRVGDFIKLTFIQNDEEATAWIYKAEVSEISADSNYFNVKFDTVFSSGLFDTKIASLKLERVVPDFSHIFAQDNRIWGVEKDKIHASALGDPFNFENFNSLSSSPWTVAIASSGEFTGGISYNGYPTFFKEDSIIRVGGKYPSQYSTYETNDVAGVLKGSHKSLAIANGALFYLSPEGVARYTGSYPSIVSDDLGKILSFGVAGAGADKYYLEAIDEEVEKAVYVFDTRYHGWTKEEALFSAGFTDIGRDLYVLTKDGIFLLDSGKVLGDAEADFESFIEFAPIYDGHLTKKGLSKLHISLEASEGAKVSVYISHDGGDWIKAKEISSSKRQNYNIPLTIKRCGYYRIKIEGKGNYIIYAIGKVRYFGSDM